MRLQMTKPAAHASRLRALILTADKFEDTEVIVPYFRLLEEGAHVDIAAPARKWIGGEHHYALAPDLAIDAVDPNAYDLLVVPGGFPDGAPATVRELPKAQAIAREFLASGKPIALIDGNLVTSRWPPDLPAFTRAMMSTVDAYLAR